MLFEPYPGIYTWIEKVYLTMHLFTSGLVGMSTISWWISICRPACAKFPIHVTLCCNNHDPTWERVSRGREENTESGLKISRLTRKMNKHKYGKPQKTVFFSVPATKALSPSPSSLVATNNFPDFFLSLKKRSFVLGGHAHAPRPPS